MLRVFNVFKGINTISRIVSTRSASMMTMINKVEPISIPTLPITMPSSTNLITEMIMTSVLRKRRLKMKKHKLRKRRKAQRALRIKIGK